MGDDPKNTANADLSAVNPQDFLDANPKAQPFIDNIVETRLKRDRASRGDAQGQVKQLEDELRKAEDKATDLSKKLRESERTNKALAQEKEEAVPWKDKFLAGAVKTQAKALLEKAGVFADVHDWAIEAILAKSKAELDADGEVTVTIKGKPLAEAIPEMVADKKNVVAAGAVAGAEASGSRQTSKSFLTLEAAQAAVNTGQYAKMTPEERKPIDDTLHAAAGKGGQ